MFRTERRWSLRWPVLVVAALCLADALPAEAKTFSLTEEGFKFVNTLIVLLILYKSAFVPLKNYLRDRREGIRNALAEAKAAREEAEKQLAEQRDKVADLEAELARVREQGRREREVMRERLEAEQESQAQRLLEQTRTTIELEASKARAELRGRAASLALGLAEEMLEKELGEEDQKRFVENYLTQMGERNGGQS